MIEMTRFRAISHFGTSISVAVRATTRPGQLLKGLPPVTLSLVAALNPEPWGGSTRPARTSRARSQGSRPSLRRSRRPSAEKKTTRGKKWAVVLGVPSPFFQGSFFSGNHPKTQGKQLFFFEKSDG